jgi:hypothetical protein
MQINLPNLLIFEEVYYSCRVIALWSLAEITYPNLFMTVASCKAFAL